MKYLIKLLEERYGKPISEFTSTYWDNISKDEELELSEDFIREFQDKLYWTYISIYQKLSEDFIREFISKVNMFYVSEYQKVSHDFIISRSALVLADYQRAKNW
jgi:hypothetical protein